MNIKIKNLTITNFCSENIEHIKFKKELEKDDLIYDFVSTTIGKDLHNSLNSRKFKIDNSYLVKDKEKLIGYIYIGQLYEDDIVELRYAVHPEYRRLGYLGYEDKNRIGYGQMILEEIREYLFNLYNINTIELHIRKDNQASIGCATKAKYKCLGENINEYYYIYQANKKEESICK